MTIIYLLLVLLNYAYSFTPSCSNCRFFVPNNDNPDLGLCNMFPDKNEHNVLVKNLAVHCRNDENLCGESGFLYEPKKNIVMENYEYIKSICSGEFVDDEDLTKLEQLELELVNSFQKMRRHNKKIIYKNFTSIYKLLKNRNFDL